MKIRTEEEYQKACTEVHRQHAKGYENHPEYGEGFANLVEAVLEYQDEHYDEPYCSREDMIRYGARNQYFKYESEDSEEGVFDYERLSKDSGIPVEGLKSFVEGRDSALSPKQLDALGETVGWTEDDEN